MEKYILILKKTYCCPEENGRTELKPEPSSFYFPGFSMYLVCNTDLILTLLSSSNDCEEAECESTTNWSSHTLHEQACFGMFDNAV